MSQLRSVRARNAGDDNLIPLINIVFLLLIFFMVAGQMHSPLEAGIALPESQKKGELPKRAFTVQVDTSGRLFVAGLVMDSALLQRELALPENQHRVVALQVDKNLKAAALDEVLAVLRESGVSSIKLYSRQGAES
ncbi:biopolymer transporter ExbD [Spongiibacter sp. KMU-158]|uniref:Biopolymer transporter ExbD n=1 Tax=Spongiibacter pelagi TaxID=2760804 RepID=A0A927C2D2_9GAMM|nr:biopolymer transporter ExbD [Spongiibacter pelagi]MBD2860025.1 biopolymer transporter ExbD [Spongiibacter pelagi]